MRGILQVFFSVALALMAHSSLAAMEGEKVEEPEQIPPWEVEGIVRKDDGTVESGYGFIPSAIEGAYVQLFNSSDFPGRTLETVCVCWLKTRSEPEVAFEIVVYEDANGRPAQVPVLRSAGNATEVAKSVEEAGAFACVDMGGAQVPDGRFFIGALWNPTENRFAFICNDQTPETQFTETYYYEDRAPSWADVRESKDPIFRPHRAIMVRALPGDPAEQESEESDMEASEAGSGSDETGGEDPGGESEF